MPQSQSIPSRRTLADAQQGKKKKMAAESSFSDVRNLLESHGWALSRISGSHHIFTKPDNSPISIPVHHGRVKAVYVRKAEKICQEEEDEAR